jgi:hypothetical protein
MNYERSVAPAPSYKTPKGDEIKIDSRDKKIKYLQGQLDQQKWVNRQQRENTFYQSYHSRPIILYNDCYHPYWNYWLLSQSLDTMSLWCYHHQHTMDQARLSNLYAQNAGLQAKVLALESKGIPRDPTYMPKNVDPDLIYNDSYVNAVYNPTPIVDNHTALIILLWVFIIIPLMLAVLCFLVWFLFFYRW